MTQPLSYYCNNSADKAQIEQIEQIAGACLQALDPINRLWLLVDVATGTDLFWEHREEPSNLYAKLEALINQLTEKGKLELLCALSASLTAYAASLPHEAETVNVAGLAGLQMEVTGG